MVLVAPIVLADLVLPPRIGCGWLVHYFQSFASAYWGERPILSCQALTSLVVKLEVRSLAMANKNFKAKCFVSSYVHMYLRRMTQLSLH